MNAEKIILPAFLIADLYPNTLVLATEDQASSSQPVAGPLKEEPPQPGRQWFLGSNAQKITLVVNEPEAAYLQDESLKFITAILGACKLNLGDVAIVNHHQQPALYPALKQQLSPRVLILFGVTAQQLSLPFTVPYYQVQSYDQCQFLLAPALPNMLGEGPEAKLEKSKLWLCLKKLFNL